MINYNHYKKKNFLIFLLQGNESVVPKGWPLTLNGSGLVLRLGEVEASSLRLGECYLCIRSAAAVATAKTPSATTAADAENVEENTVEVYICICCFTCTTFLLCDAARFFISHELCDDRTTQNCIRICMLSLLLFVFKITS